MRLRGFSSCNEGVVLVATVQAAEKSQVIATPSGTSNAASSPKPFAGYIVNTDADRSTAALMARVTGEAEAMSEVVAVVVVVFDVVPLGATVVGKAVDVLSLRNVVMSASSDATDTVNTRVWPATTMVAARGWKRQMDRSGNQMAQNRNHERARTSKLNVVPNHSVSKIVLELGSTARANAH